MHADVYRLKRIQTKLAWHRLRRLLSTYRHLRELLLHLLLYRLRLRWVALTRWLVPALWRRILWLAVCRLGCLVLHMCRLILQVRVCVLRLLWHAVRRLLQLLRLLLAGVAITSPGLRWRARILTTSSLLSA